MSDQPQQQPQADVQVDAGPIVQVLQQTHPDIVIGAYWRVRAEQAEAKLAELKGAQSTPA